MVGVVSSVTASGARSPVASPTLSLAAIITGGADDVVSMFSVMALDGRLTLPAGSVAVRIT